MKNKNETDVLNSICEYLDLKKYFFWRNNNQAVFDPRTHGFQKSKKYTIKGVSDIILLLDGKVWFIEVKNNKPCKTYQSKEQKEFEKNVIKNGSYYLVARSIDDLIKLGF